MGDLEKMKNEALEIIGQFENLPRLVVFDLDYTLWPFYCECCCEDEIPYLYPHAKGILEALKEKVIHVAVASRSPTPDIAKTFLHKLGIHSMFVPMVVIYMYTKDSSNASSSESTCAIFHFHPKRSCGIFMFQQVMIEMFQNRHSMLDLNSSKNTHK
ncbi:uncharacterized protein LOC102612212 isoform X2 [Citrus sinensis]|uniref:uncharacterized protein LOC102612212 isoform X2 n=1 Tax=Citrus sinensis TaxID=2711 RepID=UPI000CED4B68|nr:uncharacterized protein LOC102612212 isoform X2 [Citrus sinensis]XP_024036463.1 uncharacterized protein LOC18037178 isoform X2 [Citrus x clementina]